MSGMASVNSEINSVELLKKTPPKTTVVLGLAAWGPKMGEVNPRGPDFCDPEP